MQTQLSRYIIQSLKLIAGLLDSNVGVNDIKPDYYSNNPLFECLVCSRQVSSNRYATHLEKCMGVGAKSARKGSARNAKSASSAVTSRLLNTSSRSASPSVRPLASQRKRLASPNVTTNAREKQVKSEHTTTSTPTLPPKAGTGLQLDERKEPNKPDAKSSAPSEAPTPAVRAGDTVDSVRTEDVGSVGTSARADEDEPFEDVDFPSNFSISVSGLHLKRIIRLT